MTKEVWGVGNEEKGKPCSAPPLVNGIVLFFLDYPFIQSEAGWMKEPGVLWEGMSNRPVSSWDQALRRRLPFALRLLMTFLPFFVLMRSRNPCVLFRFSLFG